MKRILWGCSFGCKNLTMKFHNCNHTIDQGLTSSMSFYYLANWTIPLGFPWRKILVFLWSCSLFFRPALASCLETPTPKSMWGGVTNPKDWPTAFKSSVCTLKICKDLKYLIAQLYFLSMNIFLHFSLFFQKKVVLILSPRLGGWGPKGSKSWLRNIWMVPNWIYKVFI